MEVYRMDSFFSSSTLFNIVLAVIWFISGIRDFQGKDPLIKLPVNQYVRDPEYRAFWQKKNGVFYMLNALAFLTLAFTPVTSLVYRILFGVAILQMLEVGSTTDGILTAHFQVDFWTAISSAILICILGGLAGLAPAWRAMSIKPVDAMRDE